MLDCHTVAALVSQFPDLPTDGESTKSRDLVLMLLQHSPDPFSRHQFTPGHVTATGLVLSPDRSRILLVHHRRLDRWLLPGGHVEAEDSEIWGTARREVIEETGAILAADDHPRLLGIDVHGIPSNRREPYHLHHDLLFAFRALSEEFGVSEESRAVAWCGPAEVDRYVLPVNIRRAWQRAQ